MLDAAFAQELEARVRSLVSQLEGDAEEVKSRAHSVLEDVFRAHAEAASAAPVVDKQAEVLNAIRNPAVLDALHNAVSQAQPAPVTTDANTVVIPPSG
jgi:2-phospho-L-lactate guanylyltransferase (CobY/MobA/RfbA family)